MAWTRHLVQTADSYRDTPAKIEGMQAVFVTVQVYNAAVLMQRMPYRHGRTGSAYEPEQLLAPGFYPMRRLLAGIQIRSAVTGQPALVSIEALRDGE